MKVPVSAEWLTSAAKTDFIARSLLASALAPGRDWGVKLSGEPLPRLSYQVGVFAGDGRTDQARAETTVAARVEVAPVKPLDVGLSASQGQVKPNPFVGDTAPAAKGATPAADAKAAEEKPAESEPGKRPVRTVGPTFLPAH